PVVLTFHLHDALPISSLVPPPESRQTKAATTTMKVNTRMPDMRPIMRFRRASFASSSGPPSPGPPSPNDGDLSGDIVSLMIPSRSEEHTSELQSRENL